MTSLAILQNLELLRFNDSRGRNSREHFQARVKERNNPEVNGEKRRMFSSAVGNVAWVGAVVRGAKDEVLINIYVRVRYEWYMRTGEGGCISLPRSLAALLYYFFLSPFFLPSVSFFLSFYLFFFHSLLLLFHFALFL